MKKDISLCLIIILIVCISSIFFDNTKKDKSNHDLIVNNTWVIETVNTTWVDENKNIQENTWDVLDITTLIKDEKSIEYKRLYDPDYYEWNWVDYILSYLRKWTDSECRIYSWLKLDVYMRLCNNWYMWIRSNWKYEQINSIDEAAIKQWKIKFPPKRDIDYKPLHTVSTREYIRSQTYINDNEGNRMDDDYDLFYDRDWNTPDWTDYDDYYEDTWYVYEWEAWREYHIDDYKDEGWQKD
jgi:hypothetical protein